MTITFVYLSFAKIIIVLGSSIHKSHGGTFTLGSTSYLYVVAKSFVSQ